MRESASAANPLARFALEAPPMLGGALSVGGRLAGAALAAYIAGDQSYDRTQVFATGVAAFALLSLLPAPPVARAALAAFAAGLLFFGGAALIDQAAGVGMLAAGVAAVCGVLLAEQRARASLLAPIAAFFASLPAMVIALAALALAVEG